MSNTGGGEPNATGARGYGSVGGSFSVPNLGLTQTTSQVNQLSAALLTLHQSMAKLQTSTPGFVNAVNNASKSLTTMSSAAGGGGTTYGRQGGSAIGGLASSMFGPTSGGIASQIALFPARFMNTQISNNRNVVNAAGQALGSQAFASGTNLQGILGMLSKQMGGVMGGNPAELLQLMDYARQSGARMDWKYYGQMGPQTMNNAPRAAGFLESVRQGQIISPGTDVGTIAQSMGGFLANTGAQQQGAFNTGGAFSMIGSGNRAKSLSEWAEGILKWFMNQRPGAKRGKPFNYGEMMSQNFPGSNMDAWFNANGVPGDIRDYFWSYALGKASQTGTTGGEAILGQGAAAPQVTQQNPMYQRLQAGNVTTRQSFNLGSKLTGMYGNMEQSNRWFNELLGQMLGTVLPGALSSGPLSWMQYLPDEIRDLLMSAAESTKVGAMGAGVLGWGSLFAGGQGTGDVGDVGDYGPNGTSGMAGMHPDMRKRVGAMMKANPNLSITSGHRDLAKQQTLKRKGVGRVSGKPSAHTRGMAADIGPASQYGWLVKNAGKFGLKSGIGAGEPWHVGMGDIGDGPFGGMFDAFGGVLGGLESVDMGPLGLFQKLLGSLGGAFAAGVDPDTQMKGIASGTSTILKALLSLFASPNANLDNLKFRDVYGTMTKYTKDAWASGETGLPSLPTAGAGGGGGGGLPGGGPISPDAVTRAAVVAKAAYDAGFRDNDLFTIVSIAGRESNWDPRAYNGNAGTGDKSYGLTQINMIDKLGPARRQWFGISSNEELWDPETSMRATKLMADSKRSQGKDPFYDWGPYKGMPALYSTESKQGIAREAIKQAGVGDVEFALSGAASPGSRGTIAVFNNTFKLDGGSGGGIDVKRAASQIADTLEQQMRQRMSRNN